MSLNNKELVKDRIFVSICSLAYNHEKYIRQCLDGFIMQKTNFAFEVLIHDDASTDKTADIIREYEIKYPEIIKPIYQTENQYSKGVRVTQKYNFSRAKGKYIAMCEGDDYWTDMYKLQKQVDFLEVNPEYGLVHTEFDSYYQNDQFLLKHTQRVRNRTILQGNCSLEYWNKFGQSPTIKTLTTCFRSEFMNEWFMVSKNHSTEWLIGDFPIYFFISLKSKIGYISDSTAIYNMVQSGSASNFGKNYRKILELRKTYIHVRLFFLKRFELDKSKYLKSLIREINTFINYSILANAKEEITPMLDLLKEHKIGFKLGKLNYLFYRNDNVTINSLIKAKAKFKIIYIPKIMKAMRLKFLLNFIIRKFKNR